MEFIDLAKKRFSVRKFESRVVEQEKLDRILDISRIAPTAANLQPQRVIVIRSEAGLKKLKKSANVYGAPLAFIVCADHATSWKRPMDGMDAAEIDASIVATHMMLEATELGLGSIWVCHFKPDVARTEFNIPEGVEPINILGIGYAADVARSPERFASERKKLEEIVRYETF